MQTFTFSRQRLREGQEGEKRRQVREAASFFCSNSGCAAGSSCRDRIEEWTVFNRSEATFQHPRHPEKEHDRVKSHGHASLFNEHYLSQRTVYAQELAGASPNLKGSGRPTFCGAVGALPDIRHSLEKRQSRRAP